MIRMRRCLLTLVLSGFVGGCANMSTTEQRTLSGSAIGTAGGALIGALTGKPLTGAAIGAASGALGGYVYDQHEKAKGLQ